MTSPSILLESVNLHYAAVAYRERSLKAALANAFRAEPRIRDKNIHALKDISMSLPCGTRMGLLGRNGAGKSSLLKAIAGLYPLSSGAITICGKVRSLFELGLGFEPDATGRENILYRGLLLGQTPREMVQLEDGIVSFAGLGEFIDMPLKTYSAGMMVRLAFAISTTVQGEILLLDEILGAGDAEFQQRARSRIRSLIDQAQILVLASHDLETVRTICSRVVVLNGGRVVFDGDVNAGIDAYRQSIEALEHESSASLAL